MESPEPMTPSRLTRAVRFIRPRPVKYLAGMSHACTALPAVGGHLQRLGRFTSIGASSLGRGVAGMPQMSSAGRLIAWRPSREHRITRARMGEAHQ